MAEPQQSDEPENLDDVAFEDAMTELEQLVEQIESGQVGLETALKRYERGMVLIKHCRGVLTSAEQRIAELTPDAEGQLQVEDEEGS